ncbi:hypothetical protein ACP70R_020387 [Stipagrostis hirtigluma subsp. patula]
MAATTQVCAAAIRLSPANATDDGVKLRLIEEMTTNVDAVQERVLADILGRNAGTEYLAKCGLAGATDRAAFRAKVPLVTYEDLRPYIRRIADGDHSAVLSGHPVHEFIISTGTSGGEAKLFPTVKAEFDRRLQLQSLYLTAMKQYVPELDKGKGLHFCSVKSETKTAGGLPVRFVTTSYLKRDRFKSHLSNALTSPMAAILCEDTAQSTYAQMVCGLCQRHSVLCVGAPFASGLLRAIAFLQHNWEQLAADIEAGVTDPAVREAVAGILQRPTRARPVHPRRVLQWRLGRHHHAHLAEHQVLERHSHRLNGAVRVGPRLLQRWLAEAKIVKK